jgi:hypothetical protein
MVLVLVGFLMSGEPPDADASAREVVRYFTDKQDATMFGSALEALGAIALLFFAAHLGQRVRDLGDRYHAMGNAVLVGGAVAATGFAIDGALRFAAADTAGDIDASASQAMNALWSNFFFPMIVGIVVLILATVIASYHTRLLPRWLVWIGILICVLSVTPIGFAAAIASAIWIVIVSILLTRRGEPSTAPTPAAATTPSA